MTKRMLMIADADSYLTTEYLRNLLLPEGYEVTLFPIWGDHGVHEAFYRENGVSVYHDGHTLPIIRHIPRVRMWARIALNARDLAKMGKFDIVHNHYLSTRDLALGYRVAKRNKARWVCSFWGSDLLRAPKAELRGMRPYLEKCDRITVNGTPSHDRIKSVYGEELAKKTTVPRFGQRIFGAIDHVRELESRAQCRAFFGIAPERFVVSIGYNASSAQQQLQVLSAMRALPAERLRQLTVVLQQTYCCDDPAYVQKTREAAAALGCQVVGLDDFMNADESARLRLATDLYIHSIATDSFSASMQEYLYAGAAVLIGAWLSYPQLRELGMQIPTFAQFDEVPALIEKAMNGALLPQPEEARARLAARYSWQTVQDDWLSLYR